LGERRFEMKSVDDVAIEHAKAVIETCPEWYHSIRLANGVVTPGRGSIEHFEASLRALRLPDLRGKSVLDIGAYDGFFSFSAERLGAARVVALDHYVWSADMTEYMKDWRESKRSGGPLPPPHESRHWYPDKLPGRRPFDYTHQLFESKVEPVVDDFMTMNLADLGKFDVVLYLGVLYHMEEPLTAMRRVASVTAPEGLAVIETEAMEIPGTEDRALCEFFPGRELNNDPTNWWAPNAKAIGGICTAAGFREVSVLSTGPKPQRHRRSQKLGSFVSRTRIAKRLGIGEIAGPSPLRYRAYAHARH
jgi:tRNA (mo5U34)-methyltransferase